MAKIQNKTLRIICTIIVIGVVSFAGLQEAFYKSGLTLISYDEFITQEIPEGTIKSLMIDKVYYIFLWENEGHKKGVLVRRVMRKSYLSNHDFGESTAIDSWYQIPNDLSKYSKKKGDNYFEASNDTVYVIGDDNVVVRKVEWNTSKYSLADNAPL